MSLTTFMGYRRENGSVGIRNHVIILPLDDLSNSACEAVASHITGTMALTHPYGRLQFGEDLELFFDTLIGTGSNPNVAACVACSAGHYTASPSGTAVREGAARCEACACCGGVPAHCAGSAVVRLDCASSTITRATSFLSIALTRTPLQQQRT